MNSVSELTRRPFMTLFPHEKNLVLLIGKPKPNLNLSFIEVINEIPNLREFDPEIYEQYDWICGCREKNALFCFPCLLFGGDSLWTSEGFENLGILAEEANKHELSPGHLHNLINNSVFEDKQDRNSVRITKKKLMEEHNAAVEKNLQVLRFLIDAVKVSASFHLPLFEDSNEDQTVIIDHHRIRKNAFLHLIKILTEFNPPIELFFQMDLFQKDLESIKFDLISAFLELYQREVVKEIKTTEFVSLIVEDLEDNDDLKKIIILRYIVNDAPVERIWSILKCDVLSRFFEVLIAELSKILDVNSKLISQSYKDLNLNQDGLYPYVHMKIQMIYPNAELVQFYKHDLKDIILSSDDFDTIRRVYLSQIIGICDFFTTQIWSPKVLKLFETTAKEKLKNENRKRWDFQNEKFATIANYMDVLLDVFDAIEEDYSGYHYVVTSKAFSYSSFLREDKAGLLFWLKSFESLFSLGNSYLRNYESSDETLVKREPLDSVSPVTCSFEVKIEPNFDEYVKNEEIELTEPVVVKMETDEVGEGTKPSKRRKTVFKSNEDISEGLKNALLIQLQERLRFKGHITAARLVDPKNFKAFCLKFPDSSIESALQAFPILNPVKLRAELKVLYERIDFQDFQSSCDLLRRIMNGYLEKAFVESVKLLRIVLTIPVKMEDEGRCFSKLENVEEYLEWTRNRKNLDILAVLACEQRFVDEIVEFDEKVEEIFCAKPGREKNFKLRTMCEE